MTVYIIVAPGKENLASITEHDVKLVDPMIKTELVTVTNNAYEQLSTIGTLNLLPGDIICIAGICLRHTPFHIAELAVERKENYMPGRGIDHRGVDIPAGKIQHRLAIEKNQLSVWPYLMIVGNPASALLSLKLINDIDPNLYWHTYKPEEPLLTHLLSVVSNLGQWETPNWFNVVDMSIRDLELEPIMYSSNAWHDWIAFYPANGNFKLENHGQIYPVWLAESEKPLEYWQHG